MNDEKTLRPALCARGVCKSYGKLQVLKDLDLTIEPGCIYGLIGRNGAGKTTLMSILTGQNTMDAGSVTYGDAPVWENRRALRELCFSRELMSASATGPAALKVKNYLDAARIFYPAWDEAYAQRLLEKFGLDCGKKIGKLSKGQLSMVTITVALASCAAVTILDEPVAGLDVVAREQFYRLLLDDYARTQRTFVISTHIIEEASRVFERVVILDEGKIIADAPTDELIDGFRYVSGPDEAVTAALARTGAAALETQMLGRHRMTAVRGDAALFAALAQDPALDLAPMNLQNVFVALCGHGDAEV